MKLNLQQTFKIAKADQFCNSTQTVTLTNILPTEILIKTNNEKTFFAYTANARGSKVAIGHLPSVAVYRLLNLANNN